MRFDRFDSDSRGGEPGYWFCFREEKLIVKRVENRVFIPRSRDIAFLDVDKRQVIGEIGDVPCYAAAIPPEKPLPEGIEASGLRELFSLIEDDLFWAAGRASQLLRWERDHGHCGHCGAPMGMAEGERAMVCPSCGAKYFPTVSPAIIVAVLKGDRILLARAHRFPPGMYSVIAGFVEPGENLEQCVGREVGEETGIAVEDIRYFGSQPWPFPNSLMIAFTARYAGGDIVIGEDEISDAGWFGSDDMPAIPPPVSIARRLIDWFLSGGGNAGSSEGG